jgi:hypothetical protein
VATDETIHGEGFGYEVHIPSTTPGGQIVTICCGERDGTHIMHAESPDQSELYLEVTAYPDVRDHDRIAEGQQRFLIDHSADGKMSQVSVKRIDGHSGTWFDFRGTLQGRWKERRFLFINGPCRTYRIVHDPTSALNRRILAGLRLTAGSSTGDL